MVHGTCNRGSELLEFLAIRSPAQSEGPVLVDVSQDEPWKLLRPWPLKSVVRFRGAVVTVDGSECEHSVRKSLEVTTRSKIVRNLCVRCRESSVN